VLACLGGCPSAEPPAAPCSAWPYIVDLSPEALSFRRGLQTSTTLFEDLPGYSPDTLIQDLTGWPTRTCTGEPHLLRPTGDTPAHRVAKIYWVLEDTGTAPRMSGFEGLPPLEQRIRFGLSCSGGSDRCQVSRVIVDGDMAYVATSTIRQCQGRVRLNGKPRGDVERTFPPAESVERVSVDDASRLAEWVSTNFAREDACDAVTIEAHVDAPWASVRTVIRALAAVDEVILRVGVRGIDEEFPPPAYRALTP
jgi:hypothetical protein